PWRDLSRARGVLIALELPGCAVDLVEEAVVTRIAGGCVRAPLPHRDRVPEVARPRVRHETLLLLERGKNPLRIYSESLCDLVDDRGCQFTRCALVGAAHRVG